MSKATATTATATTGTTGTTQEVEMQALTGGESKPGNAVKGVPVDGVNPHQIRETNSILRAADIALGADNLEDELKRLFNKALNGKSLVEGPKGGREAKVMRNRQVRIVTQTSQQGGARAELIISADGAKQRIEPLAQKAQSAFSSRSNYIGPVDRNCYGSPEAQLYVVNVSQGQCGRAIVNGVPYLLAEGTHVISGSLTLGNTNMHDALLEAESRNRALNRALELRHVFVSMNQFYLSHGNCQVVTVPQNHFALVKKDNTYYLLEGRKAPYFIRSERSFNVSSDQALNLSTPHATFGNIHHFNIPVNQIATVTVNGDARLIKGTGKPLVLGLDGERVEFFPNSETSTDLNRNPGTGFYLNTKPVIRFRDQLYCFVNGARVLAVQEDDKVLFLTADHNKDYEQHPEKEGCVGKTVSQFKHFMREIESPVNRSALVRGRERDAHARARQAEKKPYYSATEPRITVGQMDRVYLRATQVAVIQEGADIKKITVEKGSAVHRFNEAQQLLGIVDTRQQQLSLPSRRKQQEQSGRSHPEFDCYVTADNVRMGVKVQVSYRVENAVAYLAQLDPENTERFVEDQITGALTGFMATKTHKEIYADHGQSLDLDVSKGTPMPEENDDQGFKQQANHYIASELKKQGLELISLQFTEMGLYDAKVRNDVTQASEAALLAAAQVRAVKSNRMAAEGRVATEQMVLTKTQEAEQVREMALLESQKQQAQVRLEIAKIEAQAAEEKAKGQLAAMLAAATMIENPAEKAKFVREMMAMQVFKETVNGSTMTAQTVALQQAVDIFRSSAMSQSPSGYLRMMFNGGYGRSSENQPQLDSPGTSLKGE